MRCVREAGVSGRTFLACHIVFSTLIKVSDGQTVLATMESESAKPAPDPLPPHELVAR